MSPHLKSFLLDPRGADLVVIPEQEYLTRDLVLPDVERITQRIERMRIAVDSEMGPSVRAAQEYERSNPKHLARLAHYPTACSEEICSGVFKRMLVDPFFVEIADKGLCMKPVFIYYKSRYLHYAIQLGNFYIDPANDVEKYKKLEVGWARIKEVRYQNLDTYSDLVSAAEDSLDIRVYPNRQLPWLFPLFPFFAVYPDGRLAFLPGQETIFFKDIRESVRRIKALLGDSEIMQRALPEAYLGKLQEVFPDDFRSTCSLPDLLTGAEGIVPFDAKTIRDLLGASNEIKNRLEALQFRA